MVRRGYMPWRFCWRSLQHGWRHTHFRKVESVCKRATEVLADVDTHDVMILWREFGPPPDYAWLPSRRKSMREEE